MTTYTPNERMATNINPASGDAAGHACMRLRHYFSADPLMAMLTKDARESLSVAVFSANGLGEDTLTTVDHVEVTDVVLGLLDMSPLGLLSDPFKRHIANLVDLAITPEAYLN